MSDSGTTDWRERRDSHRYGGGPPDVERVEFERPDDDCGGHRFDDGRLLGDSLVGVGERDGQRRVGERDGQRERARQRFGQCERVEQRFG